MNKGGERVPREGRPFAGLANVCRWFLMTGQCIRRQRGVNSRRMSIHNRTQARCADSIYASALHPLLPLPAPSPPLPLLLSTIDDMNTHSAWVLMPVCLCCVLSMYILTIGVVHTDGGGGMGGPGQMHGAAPGKKQAGPLQHGQLAFAVHACARHQSCSLADGHPKPWPAYAARACAQCG